MSSGDKNVELLEGAWGWTESHREVDKLLLET